MLVPSPNLVLDHHRLPRGGIANQDIDAIALPVNLHAIQPEVVNVNDGSQKILQIPQGRATRLPVSEQRRKKPGMQIHLVTFRAQNGEDVEVFPLYGSVPFIQTRSPLQHPTGVTQLHSIFHC